MSEMITTSVGTVQVDADGIASLTLKMAGRANMLNEDFVRGLDECVTWLEEQEGLKGVLVGTGHKDFCVGADIDSMFGERDPAQMIAGCTELNGIFRRLESLKAPVVAVLTGSALGGGYELALSCHRRIAVNDARIMVGLPEVSLGLIPGAGGTQRLPRLIGLYGALENIMQGKLLRAPKAQGAGLVDELAEDGEAALAAARAWCLANPGAKQPWDRSDFAFPAPDPDSTDAKQLIMGACAMLYGKTAGAFPAPEVAISVIQHGCGLKFDRALEVETRAFAQLATSDGAKDMIRTFWYHKNGAEKHVGLPSLERGEDAGINKIGILGAGMMGSGLGFICAKAGYEVVLKDINADALERGMSHVNKQVEKLARHKSPEECRAVANRVSATLENADLDGCDLIIEAVLEDKGVKHSVTRETEPMLSSNGIWASNTSALPITELAEASAHDDRFIGLHFFSPVERMPLLEIIRGANTSDETVARALNFCRRIRKTPIVVNDGYGFYTSRVFGAYLLEAVQMVAEGQNPVLIEWGAREQGMVVSPLQVFDEVSLRLGRHVSDETSKRGGPALPAVGRLIRHMVDDLNRIGKVGDAGFYDYKDGKRRGIWSGLTALAAELRDESAAAVADVDGLGRRLMIIQAAEVARSIDDGVISHRRDAEVGAVFGIGFAPNTGGPLAWMDRQGIPELVAEMDALAAEHGPRYAPANCLREMAASGERFFPEGAH